MVGFRFDTELFKYIFSVRFKYVIELIAIYKCRHNTPINVIILIQIYMLTSFVMRLFGLNMSLNM